MQKKLTFFYISPVRILIRSSLICGLLALFTFTLSLQRIEPLPLNLEDTKFEGKQAYQFMRTLSKNYPNRVTWGPKRVEAANWLKSQFTALGYTPKSLFFPEVIAGKQYTHLENIYVEKLGTTHPNEIIVAMAHYDVTDTTKEGAMDDASGVGVVLELARQFSKIQTDRTFIFLLTDSEEFGAFWGARAFARSYEHSDQIVAALNFDFISPGKQTQILNLCDGLKTGYTPLWFREIALDSIRSFKKVNAKDMNGFEEFVERAMQVPPSDHGAFLAAGIPAINWVGQPDNFSYVMKHYHHTLADVAEELEVESFTNVGNAAERVIKTIDNLRAIPQNWRDYSYWKLSDHYFIPGWSAIFLQILAFLPFLFFSLSKFGITIKTVPRQLLIPAISNEIKNIIILLGSMLFGYGIILLLPVLRIITIYETFPATQKSLLLYSPDFFVIISVILVSCGVYFLLKHVFFEPDDLSKNPKIRHSVHAAFLALIIFLAFLKNSYLGTILLLPPAYLWTAISTKRHHEGRIMNGFIILGGAVTFIAIATVISTIFHLGVFYWYLFLSASYGLISTYAVILFLMAITVMIRLFKSFVF